MDLIEEISLSAGQATITFEDIPSTYNDLIIIAGLRGDAGQHADDVGLRVGNGSVDAGASYEFNLRGSHIADTGGGPFNYFWLNSVAMPAASADADLYSVTFVRIFNYADTSHDRSVEWWTGGRFSSTADGPRVRGLGAWVNVADVIDTVDFDLAPSTSTNFVAGSFARLYGIEGTPEDGPFSDDFTGTNGDPWDTVKWAQDAGAGGGDTTIDNNRGKAEASNGNANSGGRGRGKQGRVENQNMTFDFQLCETGEPCRGAVWLQTSDDWEDLDNPTDGYGVYLPSDSDEASLLLADGGVVTTLDTADWPRDTGLKHARFRRQGQNLRFRIWNDGDPEPSDWLLSAQDPTHSGVGSFQVSYTCPTAPSVDACAFYDDISVVQDDTPVVNGGGEAQRIGGTGAIRRSPSAYRRRANR